MEAKPLKIAIVYDWIDKWGGVERLLKVLHEMYPEAPIYTSYYDCEKAGWAKGINIKTSFIQKLPKFIRKNRILSFALFPFAFESFDFSGYDAVISVTSSFAKGIVTKTGTRHVCILLTPTRYLWVYPEYYLNPFIRVLLRPFLDYVKRWDKAASVRPDTIVSISREVATRCKTYYGRESDILYPPFDSGYWQAIADKIGSKTENPYGKDYFLVVSRLEPYKRVDIAIEAFNSMPQRRLIVVGQGSMDQKIRGMAKSRNILFLQKIDDLTLGMLYRNANALIMPQVEDFGYTAIEAQFFGCPVLSYKEGGAAELIQEGKTGLFFDRQEPEGIRAAVARYDKISYNLGHETQVAVQAKAQSFSKKTFSRRLREIIINSAQ